MKHHGYLLVDRFLAGATLALAGQPKVEVSSTEEPSHIQLGDPNRTFDMALDPRPTETGTLRVFRKLEIEQWNKEVERKKAEKRAAKATKAFI